MAQLRCNKCGRLVEVSEETLVLEECEFCASHQKLQGDVLRFDPCEEEADPTIKPLLKRIFFFLEDEEWEKADEYCEKVLDIDPENAIAYLGKLMAEFHLPLIDDLATIPTPYDASKNYQKMIRFASDKLCDKLNEINILQKKVRERQEREKILRAEKEKMQKTKIVIRSFVFSALAILLGFVVYFGIFPLVSVWTGNYKTYINMYNVKEFSVPNGVTTIKSSAFSGCTSLTSITIPKSVTSIGEGAFQGCDSLTSITLPVVDAGKDGTSNTLLGYIFGDSSYSNNASYVPKSLKTVIITGGTYIADYAFYGCKNLTSITIHESVTSIGKCAFSGCTSLTSITIPKSVTTIGMGAFYGCTSLTSITIPESVTTIGEGAFYGCTSLTSITIPESVTSIGSSAFSYCTSLKRITIPEKVTSIGSSAFSGCTNLRSIIIPESVTTIGSSAFSGCNILTSIKYRGTQSQWSQVSKGSSWDSGTVSYTITYEYEGE